MNRNARSHSIAIALKTIARVQSPFFSSSVAARLKIAMATRLPRGAISQMLDSHLGHWTLRGNFEPVTGTENISPQLHVTGNEYFIPEIISKTWPLQNGGFVKDGSCKPCRGRH